MSIVQSYIAEDASQPDMRRMIRERHTDHVGLHHDFCYIALQQDDVTAGLALRASWLQQELKNEEMEANAQQAVEDPLGGIGSMRTVHSTVDENGAYIREHFRNSFGYRACRLAKFLNTLTDGQLRNLFNVTQAQIPNVRYMLQQRIDKLDAMEAEAGA